jgi:hypothetical protein
MAWTAVYEQHRLVYPISDHETSAAICWNSQYVPTNAIGAPENVPSPSKYLAERRLYRRDEKDQIVKQGDDLQDAARCLVNGILRMRTNIALQQRWFNMFKFQVAARPWPSLRET